MVITRRRLMVGILALAAGAALSKRGARGATAVSLGELDLPSGGWGPGPQVLPPISISYALSQLGIRWVGEEEAGPRRRPVEQGTTRLVLDAASGSDRLAGAIWVSFLPQNRELTLEALKDAGEERIVALKTTFLLGGNPNPVGWDETTAEIAEACFEAAEGHDLVFHFHTSPGGSSDISNYIPLVERYGRRVKIYLVHFGGGVSGHIRLVPRFLDWVEAGYRVYTDTTWTVGFGARWLLSEIERRGVGQDRVVFASDEPWSDFWGEYWKIEGAPVSSELKDRIFHQNFEELYGHKW